jgi:hypothetical protein
MASVTALIRSGETSIARSSFRKRLNLADRQPAGVEHDDFVVEAGEAPLVFANQLRLERPLASAGLAAPSG